MTLPTLTERLEREGPWFGDLLRAAERIRELERILYEVTTNGEWTKGEQLGDWAISKEVYETARDALDEPLCAKTRIPDQIAQREENQTVDEH